MKPNLLLVSALGVGAAAFTAELMYLKGIAPLRADLGIQISGVLLVIWATLIISVIWKNGWRYWWVFAVTSPALIGPALFLGLIAGCGLDTGMCP